MGDVEEGARERASLASPPGYATLAHLIAHDPDSEPLVFRKFGVWTVRTLLYKQARIAALEAELLRHEIAISRQQNIEIGVAARNWSRMQKLSGTNCDIAKLLELSSRMEVELESYHEALLRQADIARLEPPSGRVLAALRRELHGSTKVPNAKSLLSDPDREIFEDDADLVALKPAIHRDLLSRTIRAYWPLSPPSSTANHVAESWHFEEKTVMLVANSISTLLASILLVGSILALYWTVNPAARLGLVITFIALFALSMSICTGASRDAIFAATAAYAAVLVVFVSGNLGNTNTNLPNS